MNADDFWRGRRVLLTGHTGFKGGWMSLLLHEFGAEVHGYAWVAKDDAVFGAARVEEVLASSVVADVRDLDALQRAVQIARPQVIIHMAAQALVRLSYQDPVGTYATNVMGTVNVLEAARGCDGVQAIVVVTSDKCYENREWAWGYREGEAMGGYDPYSNSKGCAELVVSAYRRSFFNDAQGARLASGRAGNVIGGGDWALDRVLPDLIRAAGERRSALIRNPAAVRPWQHVLEPLSGYVQLAEALCDDEGTDMAEGWNFGPEPSSERNVGELADAVCRQWGDDAQWVRDELPQPHEASFLKLDSSKARQRLGWRPVWNFQRTIKETVSWYRAQTAGAEMGDFTRAQITRYLQDQAEDHR